MDYKAFAHKMGGYTVLYIEDDLDIRAYIVEFLSRYVKKVYACSSSEEGLRLYKEYKPDILLLDIHLDGMSGIELATVIRKYDQHVRIVISTAYTNREFMVQAIELSLTRYLVKPVTNEELVKAFEKCWFELEEKVSVVLGDGYSYNRDLAVILKDKKEIALRNKEVELLEYMIAHEGHILRYEQLEESVWKNEVMTLDAIRSQIRNLRKKLEIDVIQNISGLGYRFQRVVEIENV